ncbi:MAG: hypothetical protein KH070_06665 [Clostridium sp.]|nr:hypothetical protein [Clostridium sp.]
MNKKTQKKCVALLTLLAMVICTMFYTNTARAEENLPDCPIVKTYTCTVNGTVRTLTRYENSYIYMQIDDQKPEYLWHDTLDVGIDKLSTVWVISPIKSTILWWNYDLFGYEDKGFVNVYISNIEDSDLYVTDVESLIRDENDFVTGYKTKDGQTHPILTFDEMKSYFPPDNNDPTPTPTPTIPAATPNVPTPSAPTVSPVVTPPTTNTPAVTKKTTVTSKVSVKKKAGYNCLSLGSKITSKYKLTKSKLTWKGSSKSKKYSGIKSAAFIKKSGNLVFMTKKGKVYTLSPEGKKKCIVKKKAKKLILKNKFAVKVQVGKKFINLANK